MSVAHGLPIQYYLSALCLCSIRPKTSTPSCIHRKRPPAAAISTFSTSSAAAAAVAFAWRIRRHRRLLHCRACFAPTLLRSCGTIGIPPLDVRSNRRSTRSTSFIDGRAEGCSPVQITASVNTANTSSTWVRSLIPSSRRSTDKPYSLYCLHAHCAKQ